jgi:YD repeat-containing protein
VNTLYARKVPTIDPTAREYSPGRFHDVILSHDPGGQDVKLRYILSDARTSKLDRRRRYVTLNCCRYHIVWVNV